MRFLTGLLLADMFLAPGAKSVLSGIAIEGNSDFSTSAVARAAGLTTGARVTTADFDAGCSRLMKTGMFFTCQYRWESSGPNVSVTFRIGENSAMQPVRIDIDGFDEARFWAWVRTEELLLRSKIPAKDDAVAYYARAIERYASEKIVWKTETDLNASELTYVFRPAKLPRIAQVGFIGNTEISTGRLAAVLSPIAVGAEYSDFVFRRMLAFNITPLYEELGRLDARFAKIDVQKSGDSAVVTTTIDEGPVFQLASAELKVDGGPGPAKGFPVGHTANWRAVREAVDEFVRGQRNEGYLSADAKIGRTLNAADRTAAVSVEVQRGPRYVFGNVTVKGLDAPVLAKAMEQWDLKPGSPMRERYPADFIDRVFRFAGVGPTVRSAGAHLDFRPDSNVVDVTVTFR